MGETKISPFEQARIDLENKIYNDTMDAAEGVTHVQAKHMYGEQFKELITLLMPMPNDDKERPMKAAIKFYGLDHVLRSECSY